MKQRTLGDLSVSAIGLGGMPLSIDGRPDRERAIATVHAALDAGITFIDTADAYSQGDADFGHNEELIAEALGSYGGDTSSVLVATKGGHTRTGTAWSLNGRPEYLKQAAEASAKRLGVEAIGLYQFHRPDPSVPFAESVGALAELLDAGTIRLAGVSNTSPAQIEEARGILGGRLASVQNQYSPAFLSSAPELDLCTGAGIAFLPWSPLGGIAKAGGLGESHSVFQDIAADRGVSPQQVCLAWELAASPVVVPIPGASRPETITDSAAAAELELTDEELTRINAAV